MKTKSTKEMEDFIFRYTGKMGVFGCHEVMIGFGGNEIVDFMTYSSDGTFRCYEIKTSIADLRSKSKLSFVGHYNYLVMPDDLYQEIRNKNFHVLPFNISVITEKKQYGRSKKQAVSLGKSIILLESMVRSLSRENKKYRKPKKSGLVY